MLALEQVQQPPVGLQVQREMQELLLDNLVRPVMGAQVQTPQTRAASVQVPPGEQAPGAMSESMNKYSLELTGIFNPPPTAIAQGQQLIPTPA